MRANPPLLIELGAVVFHVGVRLDSLVHLPVEAGLALLGQLLALHGWLGIGLVVAANAVVVVTTARRRTPQPPTLSPPEVAEAVEPGESAEDLRA